MPSLHDDPQYNFGYVALGIGIIAGLGFIFLLDWLVTKYVSTRNDRERKRSLPLGDGIELILPERHYVSLVIYGDTSLIRRAFARRDRENNQGPQIVPEEKAINPTGKYKWLFGPLLDDMAPGLRGIKSKYADLLISQVVFQGKTSQEALEKIGLYDHNIHEFLDNSGERKTTKEIKESLKMLKDTIGSDGLWNRLDKQLSFTDKQLITLYQLKEKINEQAPDNHLDRAESNKVCQRKTKAKKENNS